MANTSLDLARTTLAVIFILGLIAASLWIVRPFLFASIWATMIVVATWPLMLRVQERLWQRRWLAVLVMTGVLLLIFVVPLSLAIGTIAANADTIAGWSHSLGTVNLPLPPDWLYKLPFVGEKVATSWHDLATSAPEELARKIAPYAKDLAHWFVKEVGSFGVMTGQFLLTVIISAILYARGEVAAAGVRRFGYRLAGERGELAIRLAAQAIRGVALGVILASIIQAGLGGIGLFVAGVPFAAILTAIMFILGVAQIGAVPVLLCAIAWLYWKGDTGWGTALVVWAILLSGIDHVLRPLLIKMGANLPLLLIFAGVIGGLIAFGLVGIFVGPVVLAVGYTLLVAWVQEGLEHEKGTRS